MVAGERWPLREVPVALAERYESEGWWTTDTLGGSVAEWLAAAPSVDVNVWSRTRPWHGTYADIDRAARQVVTLLLQQGIEQGSVVAFQLPNSSEAVVSFAALSMGWYVLVPIVHIYGRKEVSFILRECGAVAYVSPVSFGHVHYVDIINDDPPPALRVHIVTGDDECAVATAGVQRVRWHEHEELVPLRDLPVVKADDIVVLAYTSGTTSDPKGVMHDHRTLLSELRHIAGWITPNKPNLMGSPVTHATGMVGAVLGPLKVAGRIHLIDRWDPAHALEVMSEAGIGGGTGAPVFLAGLLDHPNFTPAHAATMARVGLGGAPVPIALGERAAALGIAIIRSYGSTEHPSITGCLFDEPADRRHRTDGRPMPGVEIKVVDEVGQTVLPGVPGEIFSRGPELCRGYTDAALNDAFDSDGWYRTGDIGVVDELGYLTITDRAKDIIIRGGENLSAAEIEGALETLAGIAELAVVAAPDVRLGEHACAVIRLHAGAAPVTLEAITAHLAERGIARQKWPEEVRIVADFARTPSGKIRKVDLRKWLRQEAEEQ